MANSRGAVNREQMEAERRQARLDQSRTKPEAPDWLSPEGREEWDRVVDHLFDAGLLKRVDRTALAAYCQVWSRWVECEQSLNSNGLTMQGRLGLMPRPEVAAAQNYLRLIKSYIIEFGLSPAARARMALPVNDEGDDGEGLD